MLSSITITYSRQNTIIIVWCGPFWGMRAGDQKQLFLLEWPKSCLLHLSLIIASNRGCTETNTCDNLLDSAKNLAQRYKSVTKLIPWRKRQFWCYSLSVFYCSTKLQWHWRSALNCICVILAGRCFGCAWLWQRSSQWEAPPPHATSESCLLWQPSGMVAMI